MKKRLIEAKNEVVRLRVTIDMGQYNAMIMGGRSPEKKGSKGEEEVEKVRVYVEDMAVMREQMLKVEFRNIELEEGNEKK